MKHSNMTDENTIENNLPELGEGNNWFDRACRLCRLFNKKWVPKSIRRFFGNCEITLNAYYELSHVEADDWPYDRHLPVTAPGDIHVDTLGLWVIELFPPSKANALAKALKNSTWNNREYGVHHNETPADTVERIRSHNGLAWSSLGFMVPFDKATFAPDAIRGNVPEPFSDIQIRMIQVGTSLTAVCAFFALKDDWMKRIDEEWHSIQPPRIYKPTMFPRQLSDEENEHYLAIDAVQAEINQSARKWMNDYFKGFFATHQNTNPLLRFALFAGDSASTVLKRDEQQILRYLGLYTPVEMVSDALRPLSVRECEVKRRGLKGTPYYCLTGSVSEVDEELSDNRLASAYSSKERAIIGAYFDNASEIILELSMLEYTKCLISDYSKQRDFSPITFSRSSNIKQIDLFRDLVLDSSIDLPEISRDFDWLFKNHLSESLHLSSVPTGLYNTDYSFVVARATPSLETAIANNLKQVQEMDTAYRDALSTVVSLGADKRSLLLARLALCVSVISLLLALFSMSFDGNSVFGLVWEWLKSLF